MPSSKAHIQANNRYNAKHYDSLRIVVPAGRKADIEKYLSTTDETLNGFVNRLIRDAIGMKPEDWKNPPVND